MAVSVNSIDHIDHTGTTLAVFGTLAITGDYVANGVTLSFASGDIPVTAIPLKVEVYEDALNTGANPGYVYRYAHGTTCADGTLQVFQCAGSAAPFAELAAAAFPSGITDAATAGYIKFKAEFKSNY